jgi:hypothetical protein
MRRLLACALLMALGIGRGYAALPLVTDDTAIVPLERFELEMAYNNIGLYRNIINRLAALSLKHGITPRMDFGLALLYAVEPVTPERFGKLALGLKFLVVPDFAALSLLNELGTSRYALNSIFTIPFPRAAVHANLGYVASGDENIPGNIFYSTAGEYFLGKIDLVAEIVGVQAGLDEWLGGVRYHLSEVTYFGISFGNGFRAMTGKFSIGFHTLLR